MDVGQRIKAVREKQNMTQIEFASKIGLSRSLLSQIELGRSIPTYETLEKIITTFSVNAAFFFTDIKLDDANEIVSPYLKSLSEDSKKGMLEETIRVEKSYARANIYRNKILNSFRNENPKLIELYDVLEKFKEIVGVLNSVQAEYLTIPSPFVGDYELLEYEEYHRRVKDLLEALLFSYDSIKNVEMTVMLLFGLLKKIDREHIIFIR